MSATSFWVTVVSDAALVLTVIPHKCGNSLAFELARQVALNAVVLAVAVQHRRILEGLLKSVVLHVNGAQVYKGLSVVLGLLATQQRTKRSRVAIVLAVLALVCRILSSSPMRATSPLQDKARARAETLIREAHHRHPWSKVFEEWSWERLHPRGVHLPRTIVGIGLLIVALRGLQAPAHTTLLEVVLQGIKAKSDIECPATSS